MVVIAIVGRPSVDRVARSGDRATTWADAASVGVQAAT